MTNAMPLDQNSWLHRTDAIQGIELIEAFFQGNAYGMHRHDTYAIGCTMAGGQAFQYRGSHRQSLPGHTMVLHPDEAHDGQAGTDDGFHYRMVYVNPALIQEVLGGQELPYIEGGITQSPRLLVATKAMLDKPHGPTNSMEETDAIVELALALYAEAGCTSGQRAKDFQSTKLAHDFLCDAWQSTISMEDLSAVTGRDRWSLSRDFRMFYGTSPSRFLRLFKDVSHDGWRYYFPTTRYLEAIGAMSEVLWHIEGRPYSSMSYAQKTVYMRKIMDGDLGWDLKFALSPVCLPCSEGALMWDSDLRPFQKGVNLFVWAWNMHRSGRAHPQLPPPEVFSGTDLWARSSSNWH
ncbi:AraC family ligand binding domain-containing protein [Comamonas guangdongensis]|uniref:AraC family ligand binding domain-containing protein n=1 Tax=Comamonas guangdongensis TaxID=510515 RepID=A0ABV4A1T5_9BURK